MARQANLTPGGNFSVPWRICTCQNTQMIFQRESPLRSFSTCWVFGLDHTPTTPRSRNSSVLPFQSWKSYPHHRQIARWAKRKNTPILTTNFDTTLSDACNATLRHVSTRGFSDYYPWESYYGEGDVVRPSESFGIWHINGMAHYHRSVRLGLTHYMGSVQRARDWIHRGGNRRLFSSASTVDSWRGSGTWLDAIFRSDLLIIGLALDEVEVFIRWLLIERARLFQKFPQLRRRAWYVETKDIASTGKGVFLQGVGVELVRERDYADIYESPAWGIDEFSETSNPNHNRRIFSRSCEPHDG